MNLVDELHAIAAALRTAGIAYAICGGIAVTIHGATRTTKDIDVLVEREDLPRVLEAVRPLGYVFVALPMTFDAGTERERHVQRVTKVDGKEHLVLALLIAEAAFEGLLSSRVEIELPEGALAVVPLDILLRMKRLAGRAQDQADIAKLENPDES
jgi:hypothetical protein